MILQTTSITEDNSNFFDEIMKFFSNVETVIGFISIILTAIITLYFVLKYMSKRKLNKISKKNIDNNFKNKKYISQIYVESDETTEKIRYFIDSKRKNIINYELKSFFKSTFGKKILDYTGLKNKYFISFQTKLTRIIKFIKDVRNCNRDEISLDDNEYYHLYHSIYNCEKFLDREIERLNIMKSNIFLVKGAAGNGKTNFMTYISLKMIEKGIPIIYINCKDIGNGDIESYISRTFFHKNRKFDMMKFLILNKIIRRKIYIIFEGLNENDNDVFIDNLKNFLEMYSNNSTFKFIISSRIEFYDLKFKGIIPEKNMFDVTLNNNNLDDIVCERLFFKYKEHFDFRGKINIQVKELITKNMLMTRLFFEVFQGSDEYVTSISQGKLFSKYLEIEQKKHPEINNVLECIIDKMIKGENYTYCRYDDVIREFGYKCINELIEQSILFSSSIIENKDDLFESNIKTLSITFDEFRDYLISKHLIKANYDYIAFLSKSFENKGQEFEGVYKYLYMYFKENNDNNNLSKLLDIKCENYVNHNTRRYERDYFNFKCRQFTINNSDFLPCELEYINNNHLVGKDCSLILFDCLKRHMLDLKPNLNFLNNVIDLKGFLRNVETDILKVILDNSSKIKLNKKIEITISNVFKEKKIFDKYNLYNHSDYGEALYGVVFNSKYRFFLFDDSKNKKNFIKYFGLKKNSYMESLFIQVYEYIYYGKFNLLNFYNKWYKKEFVDFEEFIVSVFRLDYSLFDKYDKDKLFFKMDVLADTQNAYSFRYSQRISKLINEFINEVDYED